MESRLKNLRGNELELDLHDTFLMKDARSNEKQRHVLNGREKRLFLQVDSKEYGVRTKNSVTSVNLSAAVKIIWRIQKEKKL